MSCPKHRYCMLCLRKQVYRKPGRSEIVHEHLCWARSGMDVKYRASGLDATHRSTLSSPWGLPLPRQMLSTTELFWGVTAVRGPHIRIELSHIFII